MKRKTIKALEKASELLYDEEILDDQFSNHMEATRRMILSLLSAQYIESINQAQIAQEIKEMTE